MAFLKELTKRLVERVLEGEMTEHLGYEKHAVEGRKSGNSRNGTSSKRVKTGSHEVEIDVPRDRAGEFDPQFVRKGQRRLPGFDDKVIALYARGMTTREIQENLREIYNVEISPSLISSITDSVLEDVKAWQGRALDAVYPIVYLDAIHVKMRSSGHVQSTAVYVALAINLDGQKELLGLWVGENEGAKFWLSVLTELQNRGVKDILIAAVDGLKGFPEAIETVFPKTQVQLCIVHMVRNSLRYVSWKERKKVAAELRTVYTAPTAEAAEQALGAFGERWDDRFPLITKRLACSLGKPDAILRLSPGAAKGDLHDQRDRVDQRSATQGGEEEGSVSDGGIGAQGPVPGDDAGFGSLESSGQGLGQGPQSSDRRLRRPGAGVMEGGRLHETQHSPVRDRLGWNALHESGEESNVWPRTGHESHKDSAPGSETA